MRGNNFGLQTRDMGKAAGFAMNREAANGAASFSTAATVQGQARSMIPEGQTWAQFQAGALREIRETLQGQGMTGLHDLRAGYASERYQALTGERPPLEGGRASRSDDKAAREVLAVELGHGRIDIIAAYIGGKP